MVYLVGLVYLVHLVCLVCLAFLVKPDYPNKPDEPNQPNEQNKPDRPDKPDRPHRTGSLRRKENRLKNHTPQGKLPPQPIATTIHSPQPYPDLRRVLPCGEVREWPNRAVSKTAVLATGPWVRSPPSPPNQACPGRRRPGQVCLVHLVCLVCLVRRTKETKRTR